MGKSRRAYNSDMEDEEQQSKDIIQKQQQRRRDKRLRSALKTKNIDELIAQEDY